MTIVVSTSQSANCITDLLQITKKFKQKSIIDLILYVEIRNVGVMSISKYLSPQKDNTKKKITKNNLSPERDLYKIFINPTRSSNNPTAQLGKHSYLKATKNCFHLR